MVFSVVILYLFFARYDGHRRKLALALVKVFAHDYYFTPMTIAQ
jgi:hypothetical protein